MGYSIITPTYNSAKDISKNITKLNINEKTFRDLGSGFV